MLKKHKKWSFSEGYWQVPTTDGFTFPEEILIEILQLSGCWLFLKEWNNEVIVINITPSSLFQLPHRCFPPTNLRKKFVLTTFWQIFELSPPIIMWVGTNHGLTVSEIQSHYKERVFFVSLSSRIFWSSVDWPRKGQSLSQLWVTLCFWACEP